MKTYNEMCMPQLWMLVEKLANVLLPGRPAEITLCPFSLPKLWLSAVLAIIRVWLPYSGQLNRKNFISPPFFSPSRPKLVLAVDFNDFLRNTHYSLNRQGSTYFIGSRPFAGYCFSTRRSSCEHRVLCKYAPALQPL